MIYVYHGFNLANGSNGETFPMSSASLTVKSGSKKKKLLQTKLKRGASGITGHATLFPIDRYCPTTNTIQANPYKSRGSGYPVDPSV